jgi:hypothetical protein
MTPTKTVTALHTPPALAAVLLAGSDRATVKGEHTVRINVPVVNQQRKSGTSQLHGNVHEYKGRG